MTINTKEQLKQVLLNKSKTLREACLAETKTYISAEKQERLNTAEIFLWWREASAIDGFFDELFADKRKLRDVDYGHNFRYVLQLFYGTNISNTDIDRKSRVLNKLNEEYEKNSQLYAKDEVARLANFINSNGGFKGLYEKTYTPYQKQQLQKSTTTTGNHSDDLSKQPLYQHACQIIDPRITNDQRNSTLIDEAHAFFMPGFAAQSIKTKTPIPTDKNKYSILLVRGDQTQYDLLGTLIDDKTIKNAIVDSYRNQFSALPISLRCIYETIYTQAITRNILKHEQAIESGSNLSDEYGKQLKAKRRLLYRKSTNEFLLSPYDTNQGVVTLAKPIHDIFDKIKTDVFLPVKNRRVIEQRLLIPRDYNLFKASNDSHIPKTTQNDMFSHLIRIDNKYDPCDFIFHDFWPFYENPRFTHAFTPQQLDYNQAHDATCRFSVKIDNLSLKAVAQNMALPWLNDAGDHIKRDPDKLWQVAIDTNAFSIAFHYVDNKFHQKAHIKFTKPLTGNVNYTEIFLSQDIAPVLSCFANLDTTKDIDVLGSSQALIFKFSTDAADFKICVPTCTNKFKRNTKAFRQYHPTVIPTSIFCLQDMDEMTEGKIDAWLQQDLPEDQEDILAYYNKLDEELQSEYLEAAQNR